ncbi:universal stress protein [Rhodoferax sp.]|uniref:universal stress protein n=1 Tax=Rhodoferax sp. TaxID=50421 RepID=UPI002731A8A0|nr:universal stress protein [Rhodoferax sp.]MDP1529774.1 universal stress protein [Rhodoferax sp.]MDP1942875.1 universal stress protein [Rhodoferax sp.]MDP2440483.1 universal stress protein [Rhodoferax sp.]MDP3864675.1 universal stress protein [Rhodoferax sp.]MDZ4208740.1 universal stress protein [Rhodoferax sp.]
MNMVLLPLAATDLSAPSRHAAQRAAMLARQSAGKLALLHVLEKNALIELRRLFAPNAEALEQSMHKQAQQALAELAVELGRVQPGAQPLCVDCHLHEGTVLTSIAEQAEALGCNLVVVGAHGAGFMRHWLLGATAERLLRKTLQPVLVVKQAPQLGYRKVLVPVDFSHWSLRAIALARSIAPQAPLVLLHACEIPFEGKMRFAGIEEETIQQHRQTIKREALARLDELALDAGLTPAQWQPLVAFANPPDFILEQEEEQGADLIVLGKHGTGMTEELLLGSVTKHVLGQARADVLVVR